VECADGTYSTGFCSNLKKKLSSINIFQEGYYFSGHPERVPVKVVFKETGLPFKEAFSKSRYLKNMVRAQKIKLIETGKWPIGWAYLEYLKTSRASAKYRGKGGLL
jgi:predicted GIY-YIG superfamily endonuclease